MGMILGGLLAMATLTWMGIVPIQTQLPFAIGFVAGWLATRIGDAVVKRVVN